MTFDERHIELEQITLAISELDQFTPGTPQSDAFLWLVNMDEEQVCPDDEVDVNQRYILAVLYFSTEGDSWNSCSADGACVSETQRFLGSEDACFWFGISCFRGEISGISIGK
jgi:hypothetical protein